MPALNCFRIRREKVAVEGFSFESVIEEDTREYTTHGPSDFGDFSAQAFIVPSNLHPVPWAGFVAQGFQGVAVGQAASPSALVLVRVKRGKRSRERNDDPVFAIAFGTSGRHLLRSNCYERNFGLRVALNLIYPSTSDSAARIRSVDTKVRGQQILRKRQQSSDLTDVDAFGINRLRDVLSRATGVPVDEESWGKRITGGDSVRLDQEIKFSDLGSLCRDLEKAFSQDDYKDQFDWIDYIRPISEPELVRDLQGQLVEVLRGDREEAARLLTLAAPEILDWDHVSRFRFSIDQRSRVGATEVVRYDMRLIDWLTKMSADRRLQGLSIEDLRSQKVIALEGDGSEWRHWTVEKCIVGEIVFDGATFVIDEGEFFEVRSDYLEDLNAEIDAITISGVEMPGAPSTMAEGPYNEMAARDCGHLLLDRRTIRLAGQSPVEICDLLSSDGHLVHVKRHLGSSTLSHLFAQGLVSAESIQMSPEFRRLAGEQVKTIAGGESEFDLFDAEILTTSDFEVVYAIVASWKGRGMSSGLPFFSKVNLREVARQLAARGYRIGLKQIEVEL